MMSFWVKKYARMVIVDQMEAPLINDVEYRYATFAERLLAVLIDMVVYSAVLSVAYGLLYLFDLSASRIDKIVDIIYWVLWIAFIAMVVKKAGTPGKLMMGLKILDADTGKRITAGRALLRQLVSVVSTAPMFLGYFWMLWDDKRQCWHDKAAKSVVVKAL